MVPQTAKFQQLVDFYEAQGWPIRAQIELTKACNFQCLHCYQLDTRAEHKDTLRFDDWHKLLIDLRKNNVILIRITGGEPTLHPDFVAIYMGATELGMKVELQTNGSLLTNEIVETLVSYPPRIVRMSVYGFSEETYTDFCKNNRGFTRVVSSIERLTEAGVPLVVIAFMTKQNIHDIEDLLEYCDKNQVRVQVHSTIDASMGRSALSHLQVSYKEIDEIAQKLPFFGRKQDEQRKARERRKIPIWRDDVKVCWGGKSAVYVDEMHNMFLCTGAHNETVSLREHSFGEAWNIMTSLRRSIIEQSNPCTPCQYREFCGKCSAFFHDKGLQSAELLNSNNCIIKEKGLPINDTTYNLPFNHPEVQALLSQKDNTQMGLNIVNNVSFEANSNFANCSNGCSCNAYP